MAKVVDSVSTLQAVIFAVQFVIKHKWPSLVGRSSVELFYRPDQMLHYLSISVLKDGQFIVVHQPIGRRELTADNLNGFRLHDETVAQLMLLAG